MTTSSSVKTYVAGRLVVKAIQFKTDTETVDNILVFLAGTPSEFIYTEGRPPILKAGITVFVPAGNWILQDSEGNYWSMTDSNFRRAFRDASSARLPFEEALVFARQGHRIARHTWNGDMWLVVRGPKEYGKGSPELLSLEFRGSRRKGSDTWYNVASDVLADDWTVVEY